MIVRARSLLPLQLLLPRSHSRHNNQDAWPRDLESGLHTNDGRETTRHNSLRGLDVKHPSKTSEEDIRASLYRSLVHFDDGDRLLEKCWTWYLRYLEDTIKKDWTTILSPSIVGLDPDYPREPKIWYTQLAIVYKVLETIADAISCRGDVSLDDVIAELTVKELLRVDDDKHALQGRDLKRQMIWCLSGTITMLHDSRRSPYAKTLELRQPVSSSRARGVRRNRDLASFQQDIGACSEPLHSLLGQFGDLIPSVEVDSGYLSSIDLDHINIAYINFYTLKHVAKLDIEWVNTMNLHLQLDKRKRTLRLYRFPALCRLLWNDTEDSFLQRLFADRCKSQATGRDPTEHTFSDYLREIILSYRLLFGIEKKAQHAFKAELERWSKSDPEIEDEGPAPALSSPLHLRTQIPCPDPAFRTKTTRDSGPQSGVPPPLLFEQDPLLVLLSTTDISHTHTSPSSLLQDQQTLTHLLSLLRGEEKSTLYDLEDFPFLGRRLADLQRFSIIQKPNDWKSVFWVDRRDTQNFWNSLIACALLLIGGGTIILQAFQLVFQIWGTVMQYTQQPS